MTTEHVQSLLQEVSSHVPLVLCADNRIQDFGPINSGLDYISRSAVLSMLSAFVPCLDPHEDSGRGEQTLCISLMDQGVCIN